MHTKCLEGDSLEGWEINVYLQGVSVGVDFLPVIAALGTVVVAGLLQFCAIPEECAPFYFTVFDAPNAVISGTAQLLQEV